MTKFEDELKNNNFVCGKCLNCKHWVWPPSELCNKCFNDVTWEPISKNATLVEASSKDGKCFGIAEFEEGIRVFGTILESLNPSPGQKLVLVRCEYDRAPKFIFRMV